MITPITIEDLKQELEGFIVELTMPDYKDCNSINPMCIKLKSNQVLVNIYHPASVTMKIHAEAEVILTSIKTITKRVLDDRIDYYLQCGDFSQHIYCYKLTKLL